MKTSIFFILALVYSNLAYTQKSISGSVLDSDGYAVPFANIQVLAPVDSVFVSGTTADDNGNFAIEFKDSFSCILKVTSIGFQKTHLAITTSDMQNLEITIETTGYQLDDVVVTARKKIYEQKVDRLIVNVAGIPSMSGNNVLDVLKKLPGVIIQEGQGSISLNSKGEVLVLITYRETRMPLSALIDRLRGMNADNIDRIEIIHQPPAKYDASGSGGIINIVLKKNDQEGLHGDASLSPAPPHCHEFPKYLSLLQLYHKPLHN